MSEVFVEVRLPEQKWDGKHLFPSVVSLQLQLEMDDLCQALKHHKPWIEDVLLRSGAILFRGFPLRSASDFNSLLESFGYDQFPYVGGAASRTNVLGRVYTANESPPDQKIPFHHEMAHARVFPSKLFFFCEEEPKSGGQTPIVLSHLVYQRIKQRFPDFVQRLEEHGVVYTRFLEAEFDPSSPLGRGWQLTFSTEDKTTAEERVISGSWNRNFSAGEILLRWKAILVQSRNCMFGGVELSSKTKIISLKKRLMGLLESIWSPYHLVPSISFVQFLASCVVPVPGMGSFLHTK